MKLRVRALIWHGDRLVVCRVRRRGHMHTSLPGGRVKSQEAALDTLVREVAEETGLEIELGPLLYVAEVIGGASVHDLNLVFHAGTRLALPARDLELVDPAADGRDHVRPPILDVVARDRRAGWPPAPRWLGNVWRSELFDP